MELRRFRAQPFLGTAFESVRRFDRELVDLLREGVGKEGKPKPISDLDILQYLGIGAMEIEAIKAITKQLNIIGRVWPRGVHTQGLEVEGMSGEVEATDVEKETRQAEREETFLEYLADARYQGLTSRTVENYASCIRIFMGFVRKDLELVKTEAPVGSYIADIVARAQEEGGDVVIENQIGMSDHEHLGKIIAYGAGLDATTIVWICERFREEHRTAVDWLNKVSREDIAFFALEIKLWRIGKSDPAPKFDIVCKPDQWSKYVRSMASRELTPGQKLQLQFWTQFKQYLEEEVTSLKPRKPRPQGWYSFSVGRSGFRVILTARTKLKRVGCELYISEGGDKAIELLKEDREAIESECGADLEWQTLEGKAASRIVQFKHWDVLDEDSWPEIFPWLKERAETFHRVFQSRIEKLQL